LLERALEQARVWSWVAGLPAGIDTHVGDLGERLSGGQRQRIALARAFLSAAPFLIFDEPTAHLDAATAVDVTETLLDASRDRGVLLITHSKIGLDLVDEVVVLDNGRITEPGAPTGPSLPSLTASRDLG
jgi:ABC-type transport system involved in cytochrome bd biosynthesis fused ATPase/permease subunit